MTVIKNLQGLVAAVILLCCCRVVLKLTVICWLDSLLLLCRGLLVSCKCWFVLFWRTLSPWRFHAAISQTTISPHTQHPSRIPSQLAPHLTPCASCLTLSQALGVDDVVGFDFLDPPPRAAVLRALELLLSLAALDPATGHLTPLVREAVHNL